MPPSPSRTPRPFARRPLRATGIPCSAVALGPPAGAHRLRPHPRRVEPAAGHTHDRARVQRVGGRDSRRPAHRHPPRVQVCHHPRRLFFPHLGRMPQPPSHRHPCLRACGLRARPVVLSPLRRARGRHPHPRLLAPFRGQLRRGRLRRPLGDGRFCGFHRPAGAPGAAHQRYYRDPHLDRQLSLQLHQRLCPASAVCRLAPAATACLCQPPRPLCPSAAAQWASADRL